MQSPFPVALAASRRLFCASVVLSAGLAAPSAAQTLELPVFTSNVVDPGHVLSEGDRQAVNAVIETIRGEADILSAVFITDKLRGEAIESLAERAFRKWFFQQRLGWRALRGWGIEFELVTADLELLLSP